MVVIDHGNGWESTYSHLHRIRVRRGNAVRRGTTIGTVGQSGNASGPHLHYEIRRNGRAVDPLPSLSRSP
jgi:murein DD-endopeptidase MepM/ murein hydrolase activator NlpD